MNKNRFITSPKAKSSGVVRIERESLTTIVLLCDSPGYRMKSYGPPCLINMGASNKLIDLQISAICQSFKRFEIIVCVGFDAEKICKHIRLQYKDINIRIVENQLFNNSNSCESARLAINNTINDNIIICDGNLLLNVNILSLIDRSHSCAIVETNPCKNLEIGINVDENNNVQHFSFGAYYKWSEIVFLHDSDTVESFRRIIGMVEYKNKFVFEALNELIKTKLELKCLQNTYSVKKINNVKTYHEVKGANV